MQTVFVSDPTTESTPVGVDFYDIGEQGKQHAVLREHSSRILLFIDYSQLCFLV